jgi:hypothetical protein
VRSVNDEVYAAMKGIWYGMVWYVKDEDFSPTSPPCLQLSSAKKDLVGQATGYSRATHAALRLIPASWICESSKPDAFPLWK